MTAAAATELELSQPSAGGGFGREGGGRRRRRGSLPQGGGGGQRGQNSLHGNGVWRTGEEEVGNDPINQSINHVFQ